MLFLNDLLHDFEPGLLGGLEHVELLFGQLVDCAFLADAFQGARVE